MRPITVLAKRDRRIDDLLATKFHSVALIVYLRQALREVEAPYIVAQILVDGIGLFGQDRGGSRQAVARLGVHQDKDAVALIHQALCQRFPGFFRTLTCVSMALEADLRAIPLDAQYYKNVLLHRRLVIRRKSEGGGEDIAQYLRIFQCALAIVAGIAIDPREYPLSTKQEGGS